MDQLRSGEETIVDVGWAPPGRGEDTGVYRADRGGDPSTAPGGQGTLRNRQEPPELGEGREESS